jgi:uncharacterized protein YecE (DUF72 family)
LARLWAAKVAHNPRFRFSALLHDQFVQDRNLDPAAVQAWKEGVRPLLQAGRLGAVVMEFPLSFRFTRENRDFLIQLRRTFHEFPLAAELPHNSWTSREARSALIDYHVGYVNIDQPESVNAAPPSSFLTWRVGYVRLHGPTGETHLYTPAELDHWKQRIARFASFAESTFVVFTNFHRGKSLINALQMQSLLDTIEPVQPLTPLRPASGPARMRRAA